MDTLPSVINDNGLLMTKYSFIKMCQVTELIGIGNCDSKLFGPFAAPSLHLSAQYRLRTFVPLTLCNFSLYDPVPRIKRNKFGDRACSFLFCLILKPSALRCEEANLSAYIRDLAMIFSILFNQPQWHILF